MKQERQRQDMSLWIQVRGQEDTRPGEEDNMPRADEEKGREDMRGRNMEGRSEGGDPTSGTCKRHQGKEKAQGKREKCKESGIDGGERTKHAGEDATGIYWLQSVVITRTEAGEVAGDAGERVVGRLRDIAVTSDMLLF